MNVLRTDYIRAIHGWWRRLDKSPAVLTHLHPLHDARHAWEKGGGRGSLVISLAAGDPGV